MNVGSSPPPGIVPARDPKTAGHLIEIRVEPYLLLLDPAARRSFLRELELCAEESDWQDL